MEDSYSSICVAGTFAGDIILHCKLDCGHQILLKLCDIISMFVPITWKLHPEFLGRCHTFLDLVAVEVKCVEEAVSYVERVHCC